VRSLGVLSVLVAWLDRWCLEELGPTAIGGVHRLIGLARWPLIADLLSRSSERREEPTSGLVHCSKGTTSIPATFLRVIVTVN
jgi:hypothetical protein